MDRVDETLRLARTVQGSAAVVFDAWTVPALMSRWLFVSDDGRITSVEADARPGGEYSIKEQRPDAGEVDHFGTYETVRRPVELRFSLEVPKHFPERTSISVKLAPADPGILMTFEQSGIDPERTRDVWNVKLDHLVSVTLSTQTTRLA